MFECKFCASSLSAEEYSKNAHPIMDGIEVLCPYCRRTNVISTSPDVYTSIFDNDDEEDEMDVREKERRAQEDFYNITHFLKW